MERWSGRVALVTGASMGIGASMARRLVAEGMKVVGAARSIDKLQAMADELKGQRGTFIPIKCDITKDEEVLAMFAKIKKDLGGVDVCINNAGFTHNKSLLEGSPKEWREMMDLNVVALCLCTRESIASMRERGVDDGHIIHINSLCGHYIYTNASYLHFYTATKFAVTALTEGLRQELREANSNIRISAISPGWVKTDIVVNCHLAEDAEAAKKFYEEHGSVEADDITATLVHVLSAPPNVQIHDVLIRSVKQDTLLLETPVRMERWSGRVALVTGASMGIGASVARRLVAEGMKVVGAARSIDKLQALADELKGQRGKFIPIKCDITKDEEVLAMFAKIKVDLGGVDVCINNAGFAHNKRLLVFLTPLLSCGFTEGSPKEWREMMDLNVVALCLCTRESIASMRERGVDDGHIIHISSEDGHYVPPDIGFHFYSATKFAVKALTEGLRQELREANSNIRISCYLALSGGTTQHSLLLETPVRMERWSGRVALVTGASMGIGASVARRLVAEGMKVVGADRRIDKLQALTDELKGQRGTFIPIKCDLTKDEEVLAMFTKIKKDLGGVDVCINNAGFTHNKSLLDGSPKEWREMMDLNVVALCLCTRESIASMRERGADDGYIIHISRKCPESWIGYGDVSLASYEVPPQKELRFYSATKFAVRALTEGLRQELRESNSNIRISAISPGVVETEFAVNCHLVEDASAAKKYYEELGCLSPEDITATLVHLLSAPPHVQVSLLLVIIQRVIMNITSVLKG
ncbi:uncharacterized protein LOC127002278 [Eriocheir sinensis]|uniref:uncharacterized protein LOC127002278 n=1 Tax=Eriocheir sinensis TaxID=95602 RepID=UPI0021C91BA2|nr:uncharacterized protein LOC127002278 [Eriocheir sinensis]